MASFFYNVGSAFANLLKEDVPSETLYEKPKYNVLKPCLDSADYGYDIHRLQLELHKKPLISMSDILSLCNFPILLVGSLTKLEPRFGLLTKFLYYVNAHLSRPSVMSEITIYASKQTQEVENNSQTQTNENDTQYTVPIFEEYHTDDTNLQLIEENSELSPSERVDHQENSVSMDVLFFLGFTFKHSATGIASLYILIPEKALSKSKCIFVLLTTEYTALVFSVNNTVYSSTENNDNENVLKLPYCAFSKFLEQRGFTCLSSSNNQTKICPNPMESQINDKKEHESLHWNSSSVFFSDFESLRLTRVFWILYLKSLIGNDTKTDEYVKNIQDTLIRKTGSENFKKKIHNEFCNSDNEESEEKASIWFEIHEKFATKRAILKNLETTDKIDKNEITLNFIVDKKYAHFWSNFNSWFTKIIQQVPNKNIINSTLDCFSSEFKSDKSTISTETVVKGKDKQTPNASTLKQRDCQIPGIHVDVLNTKSGNGFSSITGEEEVDVLLDESIYSEYIDSEQTYEVRKIQLVSQPIINGNGQVNYQRSSPLQTLITTFQSVGEDLLKNLKKRDVYYWDLSSRKKL